MAAADFGAEQSRAPAAKRLAQVLFRLVQAAQVAAHLRQVALVAASSAVAHSRARLAPAVEVPKPVHHGRAHPHRLRHHAPAAAHLAAPCVARWQAWLELQGPHVRSQRLVEVAVRSRPCCAG